MAKGVNKVMLLGNVGKDPEMRSTQGGMVIASFSLATADRRKDGDQWVDVTEWHNLVAFGRTAEIIRDYVVKGSQLFIEGKITTRSWDDKESGQKKYRTEIIVNELSMLGSPAGKQGDGGQRQSGGYRPKTDNVTGRSQAGAGYGSGFSGNESDYSDGGITDDDIPF